MNRIGLSAYDYGIIVLYFLLMLGIGWYFAKNKKNAEDYLLGGKNMHWFPVSVSMLMSVFSTYSLVMGPGEIFNHGWEWGVFSIVPQIFGIVSVLIFTKFFFKINAFTPFEYLSLRYDKYARTLAALGHAWSSVFYAGMVLLTSAKIFEAAAGWPCWITILIVGTVSIIYTGTGGLRAVVWTDFTQFFIMMLGIVALIVTLCRLTPGGAVGAVTYAFQNGHGLDGFKRPEFYTLWPYVRITFWAMMINYTMSGLGIGLGQMTVQRLIATGSLKRAFRAQLSSFFIAALVIYLLDFIGFAVYSYYAQNPDPAVTSGDLALFRFVATKLPFLMPGVFISAALAAVMSTLSSVFNSDAAVWLKNFYIPYINPAADNKQQVRFSFFATITVGVLAMIISLAQWASSIWLKQTMVEVGVIFSIFTVGVGFTNYALAIFSRKASSLFLWSSLAWGKGITASLTIWYTCSKRGEITFAENGDLGYAGPIGIIWVLVPLAVALLVFCVRYCKSKRLWRLTWTVLSLIPFGFAIGTTMWYIFSHICFKGEPLVLSFTWMGVPTTLLNILYAIAWHIFAPEVPREKYAGLVWGYSNEKILQKLESEG